MSGPETPNADQIAFWNGEAGQKWVDESKALDALLAPFIAEILTRADLKPGQSVMDIGCGAGALSLEAASLVGEEGGVLGVDVSEPLLSLAKERATTAKLPARFVCADASTHRVTDLHDAIISRFGVMFFDNPTAAFSNLRQNVNSHGRVVFCAWQSLAHNPWAMLPLKCASEFLPEMPAPPLPGAPGPFGFADKDRVSSILDQSGWQVEAIEAWKDKLVLPGDTLEESAQFLLKLGPTARLLSDAAIEPAVLEPCLLEELAMAKTSDGSVRLAGATWIVTATPR